MDQRDNFTSIRLQIFIEAILYWLHTVGDEIFYHIKTVKVREENHAFFDEAAVEKVPDCVFPRLEKEIGYL